MQRTAPRQLRVHRKRFADSGLAEKDEAWFRIDFLEFKRARS
jgi:hypothetical protein